MYERENKAQNKDNNKYSSHGQALNFLLKNRIITINPSLPFKKIQSKILFSCSGNMILKIIIYLLTQSAIKIFYCALSQEIFCYCLKKCLQQRAVVDLAVFDTAEPLF